MTAVKTLTCLSPVDGSVYAERPVLTDAEAASRVAAARDAQAEWAARGIEERMALVSDAVARLGRMNDELVPELAWQMGRPIRYGGEFGGVDERTRGMLALADEGLAALVVENSENFERRIERVPAGVVLVVAPWNYPYMTAINTIVPALVAGNTVCLKHATQSLLVGERLAEAFHAAGVPQAVFQNLFLSHELTASLISSRAFDVVNFTGSVSGGRAMERAAAGTFTTLGLELGGKDPAYVMDDADLDAAVDSIVDGAMFNAGQCCCGIERIYVADNLFDDFVGKAREIVNGYVLGNPLDASTTLGPMAHQRFADTVRAQTRAAVLAGATALVNKADFPADTGGTYLMPQVLIDVNHSMDVMREESFGPVVGIMPVRDDSEAIRLMNDSQYGLTASLWTEDTERAMRVGNGIETGTVFMNRCDYLDPALCWTGCKDTGRGAGLSVLGYHSVTRPKSYHMKKQTH